MGLDKVWSAFKECVGEIESSLAADGVKGGCFPETGTLKSRVAFKGGVGKDHIARE